MDQIFTVNSPNRVIDINAVGDAAASFEVVGTITSGSISFQTSTDGVVFTGTQYFSFTASVLKPNVGPPTFTGEERGAVDLLGKTVLRIVSSPDYQGNVRLSICEVLDAPAPPEPGLCCPGPTVFKTVKLNAEGDTTLWTPTPGTSFVLLGIGVEVGGNASQANAGPITIDLKDGSTPIGASFHPNVPASSSGAAFTEWQSPWITLSGDGFHSAAINNPLVAHISPVLTTGDVWVTISGREG